MTIPTEIQQVAEARFNCADPERILFFDKKEVSKRDAWQQARTKSEEYGVKVTPPNFVLDFYLYGWRRCHTENYWCYFAQTLEATK